MGWFVIGLIFAVAAVVIFILSKRLVFQRTNSYGEKVGEPNPAPNNILRLSSLGVLFLGLVFVFLGSFYNQAEGTVMVQRDVTGRIVGQTNEAGFHLKAPWVDGVEYSVRNQPVAFGGSAEDFKNSGGGAGYSFDGPQITVQDQDKVSHNVDSNILYSLQSDKVQDIARSFTDEQGFKDSYVFVTIRDVVREVANDFSTEQMLSDRAAYRAAIMDELSTRFKDSDLGVQLSEFSLQEVRSPDNVKQAFEAAAAAEVNIATEQANLEAQKVKSQQQINEAESAAQAAIARANGEAEANRLLTASLTPEVLQQRLIEAYDEGTVYVTDGSAQILLGK